MNIVYWRYVAYSMEISWFRIYFPSVFIAVYVISYARGLLITCAMIEGMLSLHRSGVISSFALVCPAIAIASASCSCAC